VTQESNGELKVEFALVFFVYYISTLQTDRLNTFRYDLKKKKQSCAIDSVSVHVCVCVCACLKAIIITVSCTSSHALYC
jgi:hypothetical protein